jgi:FkbM family methyltransferase
MANKVYSALSRRIRRLIYPPFLNLIEVGASGDLQKPWKQHRALIHYLLRFEPRDSKEKDKTRITVDAALWHRAESRPFYISGQLGLGSSLLEPNPDYVRENYERLRQAGDAKLAETWFDRAVIQKILTVQTRTLDDVLQELGQEETYQFLKVDTQAADYYIFKGAEQFLQTACVGIQSELYHYPLYKEAVLMPEVVDYLAGFGFELVKLMPPHGSFNSQQDGIFLKKGIDNKVTRSIRKIYAID